MLLADLKLVGDRILLIRYNRIPHLFSNFFLSKVEICDITGCKA